MKASHIIAAAASVLFPTLAHAGLLGSTIDVTARDPDASTIYADPGPVLVTNSVEYPVDLYVASPDYNEFWQVQVTDNQILITDALDSGLPFWADPFNGFVLDVLSGPQIATAVIDNSSTIVPVDAYVSGGELYINFSGVTQNSGGTAVVDFTTMNDFNGVPESSVWAMMLIGFGGLGFASHSKAKDAKATVAA